MPRRSLSSIRKPMGAASLFEHPEDALQDDDLHQEVIDAFAAVPPQQRARVYRALQLAMAAIAKERRCILDELAPRMASAETRTA